MYVEKRNDRKQSFSFLLEQPYGIHPLMQEETLG